MAKEAEQVLIDEQLLHDSHEHIDQLYQAILARAPGLGTETLRSEWDQFKRALLGHLESEEQNILPSYEVLHPHEARAIADEHVELRQAVTELGMDLEVHRLRTDVAQLFQQKLRTHASHKKQHFYPWAKENLPHSTWEEIKMLLGQASELIPLK